MPKQFLLFYTYFTVFKELQRWPVVRKQFVAEQFFVLEKKASIMSETATSTSSFTSYTGNMIASAAPMNNYAQITLMNEYAQFSNGHLKLITFQLLLLVNRQLLQLPIILDQCHAPVLPPMVPQQQFAPLPLFTPTMTALKIL